MYSRSSAPRNRRLPYRRLQLRCRESREPRGRGRPVEFAFLNFGEKGRARRIAAPEPRSERTCANWQDKSIGRGPTVQRTGCRGGSAGGGGRGRQPPRLLPRARGPRARGTCSTPVALQSPFGAVIPRLPASIQPRPDVSSLCSVEPLDTFSPQPLLPHLPWQPELIFSPSGGFCAGRSHGGDEPSPTTFWGSAPCPAPGGGLLPKHRASRELWALGVDGGRRKRGGEARWDSIHRAAPRGGMEEGVQHPPQVRRGAGS